MQQPISIVWFRKDLRLNYNLAIPQSSSERILALYMLDDDPDIFRMSDRAKSWLHYSLKSLNTSLEGKLNLYKGNSEQILELLLKLYSVHNVYCNRLYEPWNSALDKRVKALCDRVGVGYKIFNSNFLWNSESILNGKDEYYKVFTSYKKKALNIGVSSNARPYKNLPFIKDSSNAVGLEDLNLLSKIDDNVINLWKCGENEAYKKLESFVKHTLSGYKEGRNYPLRKQTSYLSPHLHFGEISPYIIWDYITKHAKLYANDIDIENYLSEIIWREFSYYLLHHFPSLASQNFNAKFNSFPWHNDLTFIKAWQDGQTGYPFVDAGMRELRSTGYMHNRLRMITASFLVKNLNSHWHVGRDWFWQHLLDADLANNSASWQWVAGCGTDAAPYFRIFNPTTQGNKFDKNGDYTRHFVPELAALPNKYLFSPWETPVELLNSLGIELGKTYPMPIVDIMTSRNTALGNYRSLAKD